MKITKLDLVLLAFTAIIAVIVIGASTFILHMGELPL